MFGGALAGVARVVLGVDQGQFNRDMAGARRRFRSAARGMESDARRSSGVISRSFRGIAGALGLTFGGAGLALAFTGAVRASVNFDRAMRNVNSIARQGETQFKKTKEAILGMAGDVGQAPSVLARGLYDIVSSGFQGAAALRILRVSGKAASAGLTDTATAAKAVNAALNAYHLPASKAREISDVLFQIVNKGVITFEELAQNMGDIVPWAAASGVSIQEVGAALSTITLGGVPAAEAATRVKNIMIQLARPSKALSQLLAENGYESGRAAIEALGFAGVIELINKETGGALDATSALTPEIRAMGGVVGITGKNLATYREHLDAMAEASKGTGMTAQAFAEQSKSVGLQWDKTKAELEAAAIVLLDRLMPSLMRGAKALKNFAVDLRENRGVAGQLRRTVANLANTLQRLVRFINRVVQAFGGWEPVIKGVIALLVVRRFLMFAAAIRAIGIAAFFTRRQLGFIAGMQVAAPVLVGGGGAFAPGGRGNPKQAGKGGGWKAAGKAAAAGLATRPALLTILAILATPGAAGGKENQRRAIRKALMDGDLAQTYPYLTILFQRVDMGVADEAELAIVKSVWNSTDPKDFAAAEKRAKALVEGQGAGITDAHDRSERAGGEVTPAKKKRKRRPSSTGDGGGGGGSSVKPPRDLERELARAQATGDEAAELSILKLQRNQVKKRIAVLEAKKKLSEAEREELMQAYDTLDGINASIESLVADREGAATEKKKNAVKKTAAKRESDARAVDRAMEQAERAFRQRGRVPGTRAGMRKAALEHVDEVVEGVKKKAGAAGKTAAQKQAAGQFEFLNSLHGIVNQFGGNLFPPGTFDGMDATAAQSVVQTHLLRDQNAMLRKLGGSVNAPATRNVRTNLGSMVGTGF